MANNATVELPTPSYDGIKLAIGDGRFTLVSPADFEYLSQFAWSIQKSSGNRTYQLFHVFTSIGTGGKTCFRVGMHRLVMSRMLNDPSFMIRTTRYVDHINMDGLDNRRENLRPCTNAENQIHKRVQRNNTSGYKGVTFDKQSGKYVVRFAAGDGKRAYGGQFHTAEEAAEKYNEMAIKIFGKFALLNDLPGGSYR